VGDYAILPNVGSWIASRDATDYGAADGVMIEGFALEADRSPYALDDWRLQMNRALGLIALDRIVIGQSYATGVQERMLALGSYLLIKGQHTYLNIDLGQEPEWWPEYDLPLGAPLDSAGTDVAALYDGTNRVYRRPYDNGLVLRNASSPWDGTGTTRGAPGRPLLPGRDHRGRRGAGRRRAQRDGELSRGDAGHPRALLGGGAIPGRAVNRVHQALAAAAQLR
jgi:hypothetical protein